MEALKHLRALRAEKPALPDTPPEPNHREIAEKNIHAFFDGAVAGDWTKPQLPQEVLPFQWLYRAALRDPDMPREMAETVIECTEDAAAVFLGERTGRLWTETAHANLAELARLEHLWKEIGCPELEGMEDHFATSTDGTDEGA